MRTIIAFIIALTCFCSCFAATQTNRSNNNYANKINVLLDKVKTKNNVSARIKSISHYFLGKDYQLNALGEGKNGHYDHDPLYRTDEFDCMTFVSTVIALAKSNNDTEFMNNIKKVRYHSDSIDFFHRNHFVSLDWNKNNVANGWLIDISRQITNKNNKPVYLTAKALINKPKFYQFHHIKHYPPTKNLVVSTIDYIPISRLFNHNKPNQHLFKQIPSGAIIEIVRPNWDVRHKIGTHINVSHMGFAIRNKNKLLYREASRKRGKIVDVPLQKYLAQYIGHKTVKGINIHVVTNTR